MDTISSNRIVLNSSLSYIEPRESNTPNSLLKDFKSEYTSHKKVLDLFSSEIEADYLHLGYYQYLMHCWAHHGVAVISPEIIFQILMNVVSDRVCSNPELYRDTFTTSKESKWLIVNGSLHDIPSFTGQITKAILSSAPTDLSQMLPDFSTSNDFSRMSRYVSLMSTASSYYQYGMMMCGLPAVEVRGNSEDWEKLMISWKYLSQLLSADGLNITWIERVDSLLQRISNNLTDKNLWKDFFSCRHCGSGSQIVLEGWITDFSFERPYQPLANELPSGVAHADFKYLPTQKYFRIFSGILGSSVKDDVLEPVFGYMLAHLTSPE